MTVVIVLVALLIALGVASVRGWTVDSRDREYSLGALFRHRPAR